MFEAVVAHVDMIAAMGAEPVVFALRDAKSDADRTRLQAADVHLGKAIGPAQIGYSPVLGRALLDADLDILHLHGIWMATSHIAAHWARGAKRPYVISPHGMLDPWITARGRAKKQAARIGYERRSWSRASLFHALTQAEADDIARETHSDAIAIIPNAVTAQFGANDTGPDQAQDIVYLGRIHTKKNIDALITAWCLIRDRAGSAAPGLTIAGWGDDADVVELTTRITALADPKLRFVGPVFGGAKQRLIEEAIALCLPSHSEGLPMVILEAWAAGIPTAMSRHCHLPEGYEVGAAIDCGTKPDTIAAALTTLSYESAEARARRRSAARNLVSQTFSSDAVRKLWTATYDHLLDSRLPAGE